MAKALIIIVSIFIAVCPHETKIHDYPPAGLFYRVTRIVDGDTLIIGVPIRSGFLNQWVRLCGLDTPERGHVGYTKATADLKKLAGKIIRIEYPQKRKLDKYNRLLCNLYNPSGVCINREMRRLGWPPYDPAKRRKKRGKKK